MRAERAARAAASPGAHTACPCFTARGGTDPCTRGGATTGLGAVIFYATGWWKVQYTFFLANAVLLSMALYVLSWRFCFKTI